MAHHQIMLRNVDVRTPDGYVVSKEYRPATGHDYWLNEHGEVCSHPTSSPVIILEKVAKFKCKGPYNCQVFMHAAMDKDGTWYLYYHRPVIHDDKWTSDGWYIKADIIGWKPPEELAGVDWTESLIDFENWCKWSVDDSGYVDCKGVWHNDCPEFCPQCGYEVNVT